MIDMPAVVRNKARAVGAEDWLERLPTLVSSLEADWSIAVGHPYEGGTEAFVADATRADGTRRSGSRTRDLLSAPRWLLHHGVPDYRSCRVGCVLGEPPQAVRAALGQQAVRPFCLAVRLMR